MWSRLQQPKALLAQLLAAAIFFILVFFWAQFLQPSHLHSCLFSDLSISTHRLDLLCVAHDSYLWALFQLSIENKSCYCFTCLAGISFLIRLGLRLNFSIALAFSHNISVLHSFSAFCWGLSAAPSNSLLCLSCFYLFLKKSATSFGCCERQIDITKLGLCPQESYWLCSIKACFLWAVSSGFFYYKETSFSHESCKRILKFNLCKSHVLLEK